MNNESTVSDLNRLHVANMGGVLYRNNSGVLLNKHGTPVRYGLGNTSAKVCALRKSSDQIGILPVVITPDMVGKTIGVFMAVEDKREGWTYKDTEHEQAQDNFINQVNRLNGIATFAACVGDISQAILNFHRRYV